jgi:hypothetical protein
MEILVARLLTGEEVLGNHVSSTEDIVTFDNLVTILQTQSKNNPDSTTIMFAPFAPLAKSKTVSLNKSQILCLYEPILEMINKYNSVFGSGIILPKGIA